MASEAAIGQAIDRVLTRRGAWTINTHGDSVGRNGIPDRIAIYRGVGLGIEIKKPGGKPTPLQRHELDRIVQAGGTAFVATNADQVTVQLDLIDQRLHREATARRAA